MTAPTSRPHVAAPVAVGFDLGAYLADRDAERTNRADDMWAALTPREQRLVREAAVMAFCQGQMRGPIERADYPKDSAVVTLVLTEANAIPDLYPTLAALAEEPTR